MHAVFEEVTRGLTGLTLSRARMHAHPQHRTQHLESEKRQTGRHE